MAGLYHRETRPLIFSATNWTGFYMIGNTVMKELKLVITGINNMPEFVISQILKKK